MLDFLPKPYKNIIINKKFNNLQELRFYLSSESLIVVNNNKIFNIKCPKITADTLMEIVYNLSNKSIYSIDEYLKQGFITSSMGERVGFSGEFVYKNGEIQTIKNFSSICVRIPNLITGVSNNFFNKFLINDKSVLVFSKTGVGKTTFIRDLTLNLQKNSKFVVVVDERNEIANKILGMSFLSGGFVDVLSFANKEFGFNQAIRTLNPKYIVTDELINNSDYNAVLKGVNSGVKVIATIHADSIKKLNYKIGFETLIKERVFDYYLELINEETRIQKIYDSEMKLICCL